MIRRRRIREQITIKTQPQVAKMRVAGEIVAEALAEVRAHVRPGVTTSELDALAETVIRDRGAIPSFKGYQGFPACVCASVNEEIVHGIPGDRQLCDGDIISVDVGTIWEGYQGDAAITVAVGEIDAETQRLLDATQAALLAGISAVAEGKRMGAVSHAIERSARSAGFEIVREYGGHGIGVEMHEPPRIPNWGPVDRGPVLGAGMTLALEPMLTNGGAETFTLDDGWTVVTADRSLSAHFEHTVVVTGAGAEILTRLADGKESA